MHKDSIYQFSSGAEQFSAITKILQKELPQYKARFMRCCHKANLCNRSGQPRIVDIAALIDENYDIVYGSLNKSPEFPSTARIVAKMCHQIMNISVDELVFEEMSITHLPKQLSALVPLLLICPSSRLQDVLFSIRKFRSTIQYKPSTIEICCMRCEEMASSVDLPVFHLVKNSGGEIKRTLEMLKTNYDLTLQNLARISFFTGNSMEYFVSLDYTQYSTLAASYVKDGILYENKFIYDPNIIGIIRELILLPPDTQTEAIANLMAALI